MEIVLISICIIASILIGVVLNLLFKNEKYEEMIDKQNTLVVTQNEILNKIYTDLVEARKFIDDVDERGIFQADDEIGTFFGYMKDIQQTVEEYFVEIENAKEEKQ